MANDTCHIACHRCQGCAAEVQPVLLLRAKARRNAGTALQYPLDEGYCARCASKMRSRDLLRDEAIALFRRINRAAPDAARSEVMWLRVSEGPTWRQGSQ